MKRFSILITVILVYLTASGQEVTQLSEAVYRGVEKKIEKYYEATQNPKKADNPRTWLNYGSKLVEATGINISRFNINETQKTILKYAFGKPDEEIEKTEGDRTYTELIYNRIKFELENDIVVDYEETKPIDKNAPIKAFKALLKAMSLDTEGKLQKDIREQFVLLNKYIKNIGVQEYKNKNYQNAVDLFKLLNSINEIKFMQDQKDTLLIYYTGYILKTNLDKEKEAMKYFEEAKDLKYDDAYLYINLWNSYRSVGDTLKALSTLKEGIERYNDDKEKSQLILIELINYYIEKKQTKEALEYLDYASKNDPTNTSIIFNRAIIYDTEKNYKKANELYLKCIELDPEHFDSYYNLGIMNYNEGVELFNSCTEIADNKEYEECKEKSLTKFEEAIPYMEKAKEVSNDDDQLLRALDVLKTLYYRVQNEEKRSEINEMIKNLE